MTISKDSLEFAIELEQEGHDYYVDNAKETGNPFVESVLEKLADRELEHIEAINNIAEGKSVDDVSFINLDIEKETKEIFDEFSASEKEGWKEEKSDVYDHAIELETKLAKLYKELAEETEDEEEKEFFQALTKEEDKHYETLSNVFYYLTDHDRWMAEQEGEVWGWMNT
ncbi:ferritin family protein [Candidatus Bipolaricaulota bacterium]|nr:ferritin family protein [Candidatus Bipolaricaulota bacterium]